MRDLKCGQIVDSFMDLHIGCAKGAEEGRKWLKRGAEAEATENFRSYQMNRILQLSYIKQA